MAYWIHKAGTSTRPNYRFFYMDSDESVSELPTATTDGVKQSVDSSAHNVCSIGSKALSLSTSTIYKLDSNNKWVAQSSSSGSSSGGGQSAYQIAVEYGFEGTVEEWLQSLNGKDGTDGTDGQTPTIGENSNWFLGENDTGKPSRGEKGEKGDSGEKGPAGANGKDGKSAYEIWKEQAGNENKTEEEFLASLKGEKGEKGNPGEKGDKGDPGTTNYNDLTNKPTLNGVEISGDKTSADYKISAEVTQVDHGTTDTTFTLPPNQYHTWGEISSLTLTLGAETPGQANGYWFSFDSGDTATTLSLPEAVKTDIVVEPNTHYECMIVGNYMTFYEWEVSE